MGATSFALGADAMRLEDYNVVWDSPSADARGSMPLGNGDLGLNAWVEADGGLVFYIGKTDAWDDNNRLLKVGARARDAQSQPVREGWRVPPGVAPPRRRDGDYRGRRRRARRAAGGASVGRCQPAGHPRYGRFQEGCHRDDRAGDLADQAGDRGKARVQRHLRIEPAPTRRPSSNPIRC